MTNRPKAIGTAAETGVVRACRTRGFTGAERRALHGNQDLGDILLCPGIILEVKAGKAAQQASDTKITAWLTETETERDNARAAYGFLITARPGFSPARAQHWWAHTSLPTIASLYGAVSVPDVPVRLELRHMLRILTTCGWGEPEDLTSLTPVDVDQANQQQAALAVSSARACGATPRD